MNISKQCFFFSKKCLIWFVFFYFIRPFVIIILFWYMTLFKHCNLFIVEKKITHIDSTCAHVSAHCSYQFFFFFLGLLGKHWETFYKPSRLNNLTGKHRLRIPNGQCNCKYKRCEFRSCRSFLFLHNCKMNLIEKAKSNIDIWKIEKYTKRRAFLPEYKSKGKSFHDG